MSVGVDFADESTADEADAVGFHSCSGCSVFLGEDNFTKWSIPWDPAAFAAGFGALVVGFEMDAVGGEKPRGGVTEDGGVVDMEIVAAGEDDVARIADHAEDQWCLAWILLHKLFDLSKFFRRHVLFVETEVERRREHVGRGGDRNDALPDELQRLVFVTAGDLPFDEHDRVGRENVRKFLQRLLVGFVEDEAFHRDFARFQRQNHPWLVVVLRELLDDVAEEAADADGRVLRQAVELAQIVRLERIDLLLELRDGMAADVESEQLLLVVKLLLDRPFGDVRRGDFREGLVFRN